MCLTDMKTKLVTRMGSVISKLAKWFLPGADLCSIGCPGCKLVDIIPEPLSPGSHSSIPDKRVLRVCDPERGGHMVCVKEGGGTSSQDDEVLDVAVVGLYSILLE